MKDSLKYLKLVMWSEEDECYIGSAPGLILGGCHGDDERAVFAELCEVVEGVIQTYKDGEEPLPPPTTGRDVANYLKSVA